MCFGKQKCEECNKRAAENFGGSFVSGQPIGQTFEQNKEAIQAIFDKHGIEAPVTPANAGQAYIQRGPSFARDMAAVLFPEHVSNFEDDKTAEAIGITGSILAGLGAAGQGIAHNMHHPGGIPNQPSTPMPVPDPNANHSGKDQLYFGLKLGHIGAIIFLIVLVGAFAMIGGDGKKKA